MNRAVMRHLGVATLAIAAVLLAAADAHAGQCERDQFTVFAIDGEVVATSGGGTRTFDLEQGEQVLDKASRGCVAMVSTNRRLLVISALGGYWAPIWYQLHESPAHELIVGDLIALAISDKRMIAFDPRDLRVLADDIRAQEAVTHSTAGDTLAAVATTRRLIGFSTGLSSLTERNLRLKEEVDTVESASDAITVITGDRILTFRTGSGFWAERKRPINN